MTKVQGGGGSGCSVGTGVPARSLFCKAAKFPENINRGGEEVEDCESGARVSGKERESTRDAAEGGGVLCWGAVPAAGGLRLAGEGRGV